MEADWSEIPIDLLGLIGSKLFVYRDRFRFRSVSKSWRSVLLPLPRPPWLVLSESYQHDRPYAICRGTYYAFHGDSDEEHQKAENENNNNSTTPLLPRGFVGLVEQELYELDLPEAHERQIIGSTGTFLITVGMDGMVNLLNPFTRVQIQLPSIMTLPDFDPEHRHNGRLRRDFVAQKIILSSSPSNGDCIAMVIHHATDQLSFARPGDASWTRCPTPENWMENLIFHKDKFYAVNRHGTVMVCDISNCQSSVVMPKFKLLDFDSDFDRFYLVEWMGELLMVIKFMDKEKLTNYILSSKTERCFERKKRSEETVLYKTKGFNIYKIDFSNNKWDELKNLGEYSLFLGRNTSISILASDHEGIQKNCIYFTDDYTLGARAGDMSCGRDMGVFDMEKKDIQSHYRGTSTSFYSPPIWLIPDSLTVRY